MAASIIEYAQICGNSYNSPNNHNSLGTNWTMIGTYYADTVNNTGFDAAIYYNTQTHELVLGIRGTETFVNDGDLQDDIRILTEQQTIVEESAIEAFITYVNNLIQTDTTINGVVSSKTTTGQSLGGALAVAIAHEHPEYSAVTFNAIGIGYKYPNVSNVTSYVTMNDIFSMLNYEYQVGTVKLIQPIPMSDSNISFLEPHNNIIFEPTVTNGLNSTVLEIDASEWSKEKGIAIWYNDINNSLNQSANTFENIVNVLRLSFVQSTSCDNLATIIKEAIDNCTIEHLESAIDTINAHIDEFTHKLHYTTDNGDYIIDVAEGSELRGKYDPDVYGAGTYNDNYSDVLIGNGGGDTIDGLGGDDILIGDSTTYTIAELKEKETLLSSIDLSKFESENDGADILDGGDGNDILAGGGGDDTLTGGKDSDVLIGGSGNDNYIFEDDSDYNNDIVIESVSDTDLEDTLDFSRTTRGISMDFSDSEAPQGLFSEEGNDISGIDKVIGSSGDDVFLTKNKKITLEGGKGDDTYGFSTSTSYSNVTIIEKNAEGNNDTLNFANVTNSINLDLGKVNGEIFSADSDLYGIEEVRGGRSHDVIYGNGNDNKIYGNEGNDTLYGEGGNDYLDGGEGNDKYIINTGSGNDTIIDSDGKGSIEYGGVVLFGSTNKPVSKNRWTDINGNTYVWSGISGSDLVINNAITVKNFKNGNLGIMLPPDKTPIQDLFNKATGSDGLVHDPIIFDLDGYGIQIAALNKGVYFDYDNDGFAEATAWASSGEGVLAVDANNDGIINGGNEIILGTTLASYDTNNDGIVNSNDTNFADLKILKSDGTLQTLSEAEVLSINLNTTTTNTKDRDGNTQLSIGSYATTYGHSYTYGEYNLHTSPVYSTETGKVEVSVEIEALPDIGNSGKIHSLHQAMALDTTGTLKTLIEAFISETNDTARWNNMDEILAQWTGNVEVVTGSRGENIDAKYLAIVESFMGQDFVSSLDSSLNPNLGAGNYLSSAYAKIKHMIYSELMSQTHLSELFSEINITYDSINKTFSYDLKDVVTDLQAQIVTNENVGKALVVQFASALKGLELVKASNFFDTLDPDCYYNVFTSNDRELKWLIDSFGKVEAELSYNENTGLTTSSMINESYRNTSEEEDLAYVDLLAGDDVLYGNAYIDNLIGCSGADVLDGGDGDDNLNGCSDDDKIWGGNGNDLLVGGEENDIIWGGDGNDSIIGDYEDPNAYPSRSGDDIIIGGNGNDTILDYIGDETYIYNIGDGNDNITDNSGNDKIILGEGITPDMLRFERENNDLHILFYELEDSSICINNYFDNDNNKIETIEFADGAIYTKEDIYQGGFILGTEQDDNVQASWRNDIIQGGQGNDTITDVEGNDTYVFNLGDGQDVIYDEKGTNTIKFGEGISLNDLEFIRIENPDYPKGSSEYGLHDNLLIKIKNTNDQIIASNYYLSYCIEKIELANGTVLNSNDIESLRIIQTTSGDDYVYGKSTDDSYTDLNGSSLIIDPHGNDIYTTGSGDDHIIDRYTLNFNYPYNNIYGNDQYYTGDGNDTIEDYSSGNDLVYSGSGNDIIKMGYSDNKEIHAGSGDDSITVSATSVTIEGGVGNDIIFTGASSNTFIFNLGDGQDTITKSNSQNSSTTDRIKFGEGITWEDLKFEKEILNFVDEWGYNRSTEENLVIKIINTDDKITVKYWFKDTGDYLSIDHDYKIDLFEFFDGSIYTEEDITLKLVDADSSIIGTEYNDILTGSAQNDTFYAKQGNDTIYAGAGNDVIDNAGGSKLIYGEDGNDTIAGYSSYSTIYGGNGDDRIDEGGDNVLVYGGDGNDTIQTRYGSDSIYGGAGNDSIISLRGEYDDYFFYNLGDGYDTIVDVGGSSDTIFFGEGITKNNISFRNESGNIVVSVNSEDVLNIQSTIENIILDNGTRYIYSDISGVPTYIESQDNIYTYNLDDGDNYIIDTSGVDIINFGEGITLDNIRFNQEPNNLFIWFDGIDNASICIENYFSDENNRIETFKFDDGTILTDITSYIYGIASEDSIILPENVKDGYLWGEGNTTATGNDLDNQINGNLGNNTLEGKGGNDSFYDVQGGNDTYIYNLGDGNDNITDLSGNDKIIFGEGITSEMLMFVKQDNNLHIWFDGLDDSSICVNNYFSNDSNKIETIEFADGSMINNLGALVSIYASEDGDISLPEGIIEAHLWGEADTNATGNDLDNWFGGNSGNNTFEGKVGNDSFWDDQGGNDTYVYNLGDGFDYIDNFGGYDSIQFGANITTDIIRMERQDYGNLFIYFDGYEGGITIGEHFNDDNKKFERILLSDGTEITDFSTYLNDVEVTENYTVQEGSFAKDVYVLGEANVTVIGDSQDNHIEGNSGNNTFEGKGGNDSFYDDKDSNETYVYNLGDGFDYITDIGGYDTIQFGAGLNVENMKVSNQNNYNLEIWFDDIEGNIVIEGFFADEENKKIERLEFADGTVITNINQYINVIASEGNIVLPEGYSQANLWGEGNTSATGNSLDNWIGGNSGNNTFEGKGGNDYFSDDQGGNDTYIYNLGDGNDHIVDVSGVDIIQFGNGITTENIRFRQENNSLYIWIEEVNDSGIRVENYFTNENNKIESFEFYDGTIISDISSLIYSIGTEGSIILPEGAKNAYLWGNANTTAIGNDLDNQIEGNSGNNVITGGLGNDSLYDDQGGNDTYNFAAGHGEDQINDFDGNDTIYLNSSVAKADIAIYMSGTDLVIDYGEDVGQDRIVVLGQSNSDNAVETIQLSDGTYISNTDVNQLIQTMTAYAASNDIQLTSINDVKNNQDLMTLVANSWHS